MKLSADVPFVIRDTTDEIVRLIKFSSNLFCNNGNLSYVTFSNTTLFEQIEVLLNENGICTLRKAAVKAHLSLFVVNDK